MSYLRNLLNLPRSVVCCYFYFDDLLPILPYATIAARVPMPLSFQTNRSVNIPSTFSGKELGPGHRDKETSCMI